VIRLIKVAGLLIAGMAVWSVASSYLFVYVGGLAGQFDRPWLVWWTYAKSDPDGWTKVVLATTAIAPPALIGVVVIALRRVTSVRHRLRRPLYGNSTWASDDEMRAGGIRQSRSPF
jgi:hypothetical protein